MPPKTPTTSFTTTLRKSTSMDAMGIEVPPAAMAALGPGKRPKVTVTLNGYTYRSTVAVMGGAFLLPLAKVHREVEVPADLASALKKAKVLAAFEAKSFTQRKEWVRGVEEAKAAETRARRITKVVDALAG